MIPHPALWKGFAAVYCSSTLSVLHLRHPRLLQHSCKLKLLMKRFNADQMIFTLVLAALILGFIVFRALYPS